MEGLLLRLASPRCQSAFQLRDCMTIVGICGLFHFAMRFAMHHVDAANGKDGMHDEWVGIRHREDAVQPGVS